MTIRFVPLRTTLFAACALLPFAASAQSTTPWPEHPVTIVVGSAPGGSNDVFARALGKRLGDTFGQTFVVDNKPAGGGVIANQTIARAKPDGYTLVVVSSTFTTSASIRTDLPYDALKDFKPVALLAKGPLLITVNKDSPYKTLGDLVAAAKANPGKLNYGSSGLGSINQFATEVFAGAAGIKMTHVPYKGMAPATNDLLGGQIDVLVASAPSIGAMVKGDKVRALAVTTAKKSAVAPDLPAMEQSGYRNSSVDLWWGVLAPPGTPQAIVDKLNAEINKQIASADMKEFFLREGAEPAPMSSADFATFLSAEMTRWKSVAKAADIRPE
ncbi:tripartite tricarboxylate transporter substrate binding protein [soil metagenome]